MTRFFLFVLVLAAVAAAFYGGRKYKGAIPYLDRNQPPIAESSPTPVSQAAAPGSIDASLLKFAKTRLDVDNDPNGWLTGQLPGELSRQGLTNPLESQDPGFLYLYGRALFLTDRQKEAVAAFDKAIERINENTTPRNGELKIDARLAKVAAQLRAGDEQAARAAADDLAEVIRSQPGGPNANAQPSPGVSP